MLTLLDRRTLHFRSPSKSSIMGRIPFTRLPMASDATATITDAAFTLPPPIPTTTTDIAMMHYINTRVYASLVQPAAVQTTTAEAVAMRRRQEEETTSICLVHLLITCTGAIQAGDYSVAHGALTEARTILKEIPTSTGIGRVGTHFADALAQRLFPAAYPHAVAPPPPATSAAATYNHFHDAGPYLKFAYSTANRAILKAFEGCKRVHVVDFAVKQGLQWLSFMDELARREGGPLELLRITGIGPNPTSGRDELHEVGIRLAEHVRRLKIPFTFQGICTENLHQLSAWIHLRLAKDEVLAINSILQLHRLLVDPDTIAVDDYAPIDILLKLVVKLKPKIFTVVEQEEEHNKLLLLERFTNAIFHYATMFDSLEACPVVTTASASATGDGAGSTSTSTTTSSTQLAEAYLRGEIFNIICDEGSARTERHELFTAWKERLTRAGFTQVEFDRSEANLVIADLIKATSFSGSGFTILQGFGSLALAWHDRPLYVATAWHAMGGGNAAASSASAAPTAHTKRGGGYQKGRNGNRGRRGGAAGGGIIFM